MTSADTLYELFGVPSTCTDDELRRAYHRALLEHHPDKNLDKTQAATVKTQQVTLAYSELRNRRSIQTLERQGSDSDADIKITVDGFDVTIQFGFSSGVDIDEIAGRKLAFRKQWEDFRENPTDPLTALRLVHAAFRAEQQDSIKDLLVNAILIDSASMLLSLVPTDDACETLVRWIETLEENQKGREAVQILEDAYATGTATPSVAEELRRMHYAWAQYADPTTGNKAIPEVRIEHLHRILDLGFKYDYIYKMVAEAYHDLGNDEQARVCLREAYELNPQLSGAVRISRTLGFTQSKHSPRKKESPRQYVYSKPEQIPSSKQVNEWVQSGDWDSILSFANPHDYSPRILPKSRAILRQIASSLERCNTPKALEALMALLSFTYYWDVTEAAMTSLSKVGDKHALHMLEEFRAGSSREQSHLQACLSYMRGRLTDQVSPANTTSTRQLIARAKSAFLEEDYGRARILLENLLENTAQSDSTLLGATVLLARSCAKMEDVRTAVALIGPVLPSLSRKTRGAVIQEVASWLWSDLAFQEYAPHNDNNYILALEIHLELISKGNSPDDVLKNFPSLARWLELLGSESLVQWIGQLIRIEAPGTWYVDKLGRDRYLSRVELSQHLRSYLASFSDRLRSCAVTKLRETLKSTHALEKPVQLLDED